MTVKERLNYLNKVFTPDQISEIEQGLAAGIDISVYAKPCFLAIQMRQIRKALMEHLSIEEYAKPEFDWFQLEEIREGLHSFVEVKKYASPDIPYEKMRQIRKGLECGIDLSGYLNLEAGVIRQIRKALISKVDIQVYVTEGYDKEQLEEIRLALEEGLDIHQYLKKEFRGVSIQQIRKGLKANLDVSVYAKEEYDWRQMRELRKGLLSQVDVMQYSNHWYSWKQMQEIRLGLEGGLDVAGYRSLMYTASEMRKKRLELMALGSNRVIFPEQKEKAEEDGEPLPGNKKGFVITVRADGMEAYARVVDPSVEFTRKQVLSDLAQEGIVYGIDQQEVDRLVSRKDVLETVVIARGKPPIQGEDGYYEYFFRTEISHRPKVQKDGSVDYQNVDWFEQVKKDQKIAYYHSAGAGEVGYTVQGKRLPAKRGREQVRLRGKGIVIMPDQKTYLSGMDGRIELVDTNRVEISEMIEFQDVSLSTGNIRFDGNVYIRGSVGIGTRITASEDVVVDGFVEAATIEAGGNIILRKGVNGSGTGSLKAGGNIEGKFFETVTIHAENDIQANYCLNCEVYAGGTITICGSNGSVAGGVLSAVKCMEAHRVGNRAGHPTKINLGITEEMRDDLKAVEDKIREHQMELAILENAKADVQSKYPPEVRNTMEIYLKIENAIFTKNKIIQDLVAKRDGIQNKITDTLQAKLVVTGDLYEGVLIDINGRKWNSQYVQNVTVRVTDDKIALYTNKG